jgi:hypothetical protein
MQLFVPYLAPTAGQPLRGISEENQPTRDAPKTTTSSYAPSEDWAALFARRAVDWELGGRSRAEAEKIAWAETQNRWHMEHGERVSRDLCAGCRRPIGTKKALDLIDGNRVHIGEDNACLIRHGERWRAAAMRALGALGLRPPSPL